jgi:sugar phosphate isomerase/epimerase
MKLCITIGTQDAYPGALVVFRGLEENLKTIADLGYDGIELALFDKSNIEVSTLKRQLQQSHLDLPVISTGQIFTMQNVWFTHPDRTVRDRAVQIFKGIIEVAAEFGADVNVSRVRGYIHEHDSQEDALKRLTECLRQICVYAAEFDVNILLEQMNRYETNYMNSAAEVGDYIRTTNLSNLKIHADLFHMNIEDACIKDTLKHYADILGYIHFADSNRLAPGLGHLDFPAIISTLKEIHYQGWIGVEALTKPDSLTAAKQSITYLKQYL